LIPYEVIHILITLAFIHRERSFQFPLCCVGKVEK